VSVQEIGSRGSAPEEVAAIQQTITDLRRRAHDVSGVMVATSDGLPLAHDLPPENHLQTAAMAATAVGLSRRIVETFGHGGFEEAVVRGRDGYLIVYSAGPRAVLAVLASGEANLGLLHHVARRAASRVSELLV
jgi:predicted regulator of Ras-like GTPase activity (Roadblock/LC7/MglB family)